MASLGGRNHLRFSAGRQAAPRGTRGRGAYVLGAAERNAAQRGSAHPGHLPGDVAPLSWVGSWSSLPSASLRMVRSGWVTRWARCRACRPGEHWARGSSLETASRAPTVTSGFRPGIQETASARVGLVLGYRAEWKAGMVNTGEREVTGSTPERDHCFTSDHRCRPFSSRTAVLGRPSGGSACLAQPPQGRAGRTPHFSPLWLDNSPSCAGKNV